ncbi:hypothetical protein Dimus_003573, partial [Dionaea muscipula]
KHDVDASKGSDELLSEWLQKAKQGEDNVSKSVTKKKKTTLFARENTPREVDPSVKRQNMKKRSMKK